MDEDACGLAAAVDVECLRRRRAVALDARLADSPANLVATRAVARDYFLRILRPDALLVLVVERPLVVVEENLLQAAESCWRFLR
jgi:hypothetical protein